MKAPGTCGELVQGTLAGQHFHVTCPIDIYATVSVDLYSGSNVVVGPKDCPKAVHAVHLALEKLDANDTWAIVEVSDPLPRGKGMASSTADVAAAIAATGIAFGKPFDAMDIARLALQVEPSDGLMFPGIVAFDHRSGSMYEALGNPAPLRILILDFGGAVDTQMFNARDLGASLNQRETRWRESLALVREGLQSGDTRLIGHGATLDSITYAEVVTRPHLPGLLALAKDVGALGVNTAHSGTVMGLLFDLQADLSRPAREARARFPQLEGVYTQTIVAGGTREVARQDAVSGPSGRALAP